MTAAAGTTFAWAPKGGPLLLVRFPEPIDPQQTAVATGRCHSAEVPEGMDVPVRLAALTPITPAEFAEHLATWPVNPWI